MMELEYKRFITKEGNREQGTGNRGQGAGGRGQGTDKKHSFAPPFFAYSLIFIQRILVYSLNKNSI